ncbi:MAG: T9SS type A sorting domain-containing protein [Lewinella sp.]
MNSFSRRAITFFVIGWLTFFAIPDKLLATGYSCLVPHCPQGTGWGFQQDTDPPVSVSRTYVRNPRDESSAGAMSRGLPKLIQRKANPSNKSADAVIITYDDFLAHMAPGLERLVQVVVPSTTIPMDVGGEDQENLVWNMPDLSLYGPVLNNTTWSEVVSTTPYVGDFPGAAISHAFRTGTYYEYYELIPDSPEQTGAAYYHGGANAEFIYPGDVVHAPVPLSLGLGLFESEFDAVDCAQFEGGCGTGNSAEAYLQMTQEFEEVASGILNTFDGESTEAIKVRNSIITRVFDADDNLLEESIEDFIIWYSVDGHYIRAGLADGAPWVDNTSFDYMEYRKIFAGALPVEWQSVTAEVKKDREVEVRWSTATEAANDHFIVERSTDGSNFLRLGVVPAVGNSAGPEEYQFSDEAAQEGFNYYRIKQVDLDESSSYSSVVSALVALPADGEALTVLYPNPGRNEVFFSRPASYELFNASGQRLASGMAEGSLDVSSFPAGQYLVRLDGGKLHRWVKQ